MSEEKTKKDIYVSARQSHLVTEVTQRHTYDSFTLTATGTKQVSLIIPFMVKRVKFNFSYYFKSDINVNFLVTSDLVYNDVVGNLNKFAIYSAVPQAYTIGTLTSDTIIEYVFKEPRQVNGTYNFKFTEQNGATIVSGTVLLHCEFLDQ